MSVEAPLKRPVMEAWDEDDTASEAGTPALKRVDVAAHVAAHACSLSMLAQRHDLPFLAQLLRMAAAQAADDASPADLPASSEAFA